MGTEMRRGAPSGIGAGSMLAAARDAGWAVGDDVGVEYVSRMPGPPLDGLIDDLYYLEGAPPAMAAMNHSHSFNGVLPGYMSGQRDHDVYEQSYRPQDRAALLHMAEEAEGGESAALVAYWLDRSPGDFHVHHRRKPQWTPSWPPPLGTSGPPAPSGPASTSRSAGL